MAIISAHLEVLDRKSNTLINENNEQIKINLQLQDRINRVVLQLNEQHRQITKNLIAARSDTSNKKEFKILQEIFKLNICLDNLKLHLENIFQAVQFAKLKIISKNILSFEELDFVTKRLESQGITISN